MGTAAGAETYGSSRRPGLRRFWRSRTTRTAARGDGAHGGGKQKRGANGADLEVKVPVGTTVHAARRRRRRRSAARQATERSSHGVAGAERETRRFLSNRRRAPAFAEQAELGEEHWLNLELRLVADVALVGFPNVGQEHIHLGGLCRPPEDRGLSVHDARTASRGRRHGRSGDETEFIVADIPGLVEGAAEGKGLGHQFLRHVERARVLAVSGRSRHLKRAPGRTRADPPGGARPVPPRASRKAANRVSARRRHRGRLKSAGQRATADDSRGLGSHGRGDAQTLIGAPGASWSLEARAQTGEDEPDT